MEIKDVSVLAAKVRENMEKVMVGKSGEIELILTALICGGHVLLDDVPGTGKTVTAKALARSLDCDFKRIQFTPDLLPSDVTGMSVFNQKESVFEFRPGPAFTSILLADEINRATPRTQSALLECMEERQITVDGETHVLAEPFFVIATQNPVESSGAFPLPEAQLDRFLFRLSLGYPDAEGEMEMMERFINASPLEELRPVASAEEIIAAREACRKVEVSEPVRRYMTLLTDATRRAAEVSLGVSPRGLLWLMRASQVYAAVSGREYVLPDDVKALVPAVFTHRITCSFGQSAAGSASRVVSDVLAAVPVPTEETRA
jgi:MoxR-like ATPase